MRYLKLEDRKSCCYFTFIILHLFISVDCLTPQSANKLYLQCRDGIVTWIKKKIGPGIYNITTTEDAERILTSEDKVVLGYLNSLVVCVHYLNFFP